MPESHQRRRGRLFVALAAIVWSTAGVFQRELSVGAATQLAGRALFAALGLLVYVSIAERGRVRASFRATGRGGAAIVVLLAVSSASFLLALNYASVANVLFMQALAPVIAAALGTLLGERVGTRTWAAMGVAVVGVALMVGGPGATGGFGQALSALMALSFAATLVITRHRRDVSMAPATCLSQVLVVVAVAPFAHPLAAHAADVGLLALLGIGQIGLGFVFLTIGGRLIPAGEVALITLLEIVLGPLWVWLILAERPASATLLGGGVVLAAVLLQARSDRGEPQPAVVP